MKKSLLRLFLLPVMVCAMLGISFMNSAGMAHAATLQTHTVQHYANPGHQCPSGDVEFDDINVHPYCYSANGQYNEQWLADIYIVNTGSHTIWWDWADCNGDGHHSEKPPGTIVTSQTTPGGFAGYWYMCQVIQFNIS